MRLRHIKDAEIKIYDIDYVINEKEIDENTKNFLYEEKPLHIEIGMGKGDFIKGLARKNPNINYIGIEKFASIILKADVKIKNEELPNLKLLCIDAISLPEFFAQVPDIKVEKIYLNFSDPWPKRKYAEKRLTSKTFLEIYKNILSNKGCIEFKTDNREFFDYSMKTLKENGWVLEDINYDIHNIEALKQNLIIEGKTFEDYFDGKIMTEYEKKWTKKGNKICYLKANILKI